MDANFKNQILHMSENEWQEFRINKWKQSRKYLLEHKMPPPDFFLSTKENYINFCESKTNKEKMTAIFSPTQESKDFKMMTEYLEKQSTLFHAFNIDIELLDKKWWEILRRGEWNKRIQTPADKPFIEPPASFMSNQAEYAKLIQELEGLRKDYADWEKEEQWAKLSKESVGGYINQLKNALETEIYNSTSNHNQMNSSKIMKQYQFDKNFSKLVKENNRFFSEVNFFNKEQELDKTSNSEKTVEEEHVRQRGK